MRPRPPWTRSGGWRSTPGRSSPCWMRARSCRSTSRWISTASTSGWISLRSPPSRSSEPGSASRPGSSAGSNAPPHLSPLPQRGRGWGEGELLAEPLHQREEGEGEEEEAAEREANLLPAGRAQRGRQGFKVLDQGGG